MTFKIEIDENGVSIRKGGPRTLIDPTTNEQVVVNEPYHREAIGLGNYAKDPANPTPSELKSCQEDIAALISKHVGDKLAATISKFKTENDQLEAIKADRDAKAKEIIALKEELTKSSTSNTKVTKVEGA